MKFRIMPPTYLFISILAIISLHFLLPLKKVLNPPCSYLTGLALMALGSYLSIWADWIFRKKAIPIEPHEEPPALQVSGPFSFSRHPMYLGMSLLVAGAAAFTGSISAFVVPLVFAALMNGIFIRYEEANLERIFGERYMEYKRRVRCWI